ncbi:MAG: YbhB/YbcL family Raf kinase inhibitor-like protein [Moraxellaceae bacterium]|nr:YbhB/YbcL family Raf kinase inhibitor-like protein [Moraxellaceae bacterium]MDP1776051.1 YbhB/YbcL family Raf kinase inhibitor-like protein [Moraxellaceae bacterium]
MKLTSQTLVAGERIPVEHAMGVAGPTGPVPGANISPQLSWSDFPAETKSFVLICHDPDVPSRADDVNQADRVVPYDLPRVDFFHWVLVDIPLTVTALAQGQDGEGITPKGKAPGAVSIGVRGINDYTSWFASDADMAGNYGGYDGPWPPFNDERLHHYHFTVYALSVPSLSLSGLFDGRQVQAAMEGKVLAQDSIVVTYSLAIQARA